MSRVERKKNENNQVSNNRLGRKALCILAIITTMIIGIIKVDDSYRSMLLVEGPRVIQYERLNEDIHQLYFLGNSLLVDEKKIEETYNHLREEIKVVVEIVKQHKDQLVKSDDY